MPTIKTYLRVLGLVILLTGIITWWARNAESYSEESIVKASSALRPDQGKSTQSPTSVSTISNETANQLTEPTATQAQDSNTSREEGATDINAKLQALVEFQKRNPGTPVVPLFRNGVDRFLTEKFISAFDLSENEVVSLNEALNEAKIALREQMAANAVVVSSTESYLMLEVQEFDGIDIMNKLISSFRENLGPERFQYFDLLSGTDLPKSFDYFGEGRVKISVRPFTGAAPINGSPRPDYIISRVGDPPAGMQQRGPTVAMSDNSLPMAYDWMNKYRAIFPAIKPQDQSTKEIELKLEGGIYKFNIN